MGTELETERRRLEHQWAECVNESRYSVVWKGKRDFGMRVKESLDELRGESVDLRLKLQLGYRRVDELRRERTVGYVYALEEHAVILEDRYIYGYEEYLEALRQYHLLIRSYTRACVADDWTPTVVEELVRRAGGIVDIVGTTKKMFGQGLELMRQWKQ